MSPLISFFFALVVELVDPPRVERVRFSTLTIDEVFDFLDAAKDTDYYVFFPTLIFTGLRRGELLSLKWRNIELAQATLSVVETAVPLESIPITE